MKNNTEQLNFKAHASHMFNKFINTTKCLHIRIILRNSVLLAWEIRPEFCVSFKNIYISYFVLISLILYDYIEPTL